ncbi:MAG TPA: hypothetical protein VF412_03785 [Bdellovibrio sp.]|uniref:hypothetical protein n=1 Tax=Bdellovibrio sp. TaxID=28201 RepID=UPI002EE41FF0
MKKALFAWICVMMASPAFAAKNYKCVGTEPFWNISVVGDSLKVGAPGEQDMTLKITQRLYPQGMSESVGEAIIAQDEKTSVHMIVREDGKCNDGMSDKLYSREVWVTLNNKLLVGCCDAN